MTATKRRENEATRWAQEKVAAAERAAEEQKVEMNARKQKAHCIGYRRMMRSST